MSGQYEGGKADLTEWRQEVFKAQSSGELDPDVAATLLLITAPFRADGTGFLCNDDLGWSPRTATRRIAAALDSGWIVRTNIPRRGTSSDYEVSYPELTTGVQGTRSAPRGRVTRKVAKSDYLSDEKGSQIVQIGSQNVSHRWPHMATPSTTSTSSARAARSDAAGAAPRTTRKRKDRKAENQESVENRGAAYRPFDLEKAKQDEVAIKEAAKNFALPEGVIVGLMESFQCEAADIGWCQNCCLDGREDPRPCGPGQVCSRCRREIDNPPDTWNYPED